jgi:hypothetical protein
MTAARSPSSVPAASPPRGAAGTPRRTRKPPLTGLALIASKMPENGGAGSLEHALIMMLKNDFPGVRKQHNSDSRRAHRGFPDWILAGPGGMAAWELKREGEDPTDEQQGWLDDFEAAGIPSGCRRPSDLLSGRIARELAALAGMGGAR